MGDPFQRSLQAVPRLFDQLRAIGDGRFAAMDGGNISLQIISHAFTPGKGKSFQLATLTNADIRRFAGSPNVENCRAGNNELAQAIANSGRPARLAAFAVLPCSNAAESAHELR